MTDPGSALYSAGAIARILGMRAEEFVAWLQASGQAGDVTSLFTREDVERLRFLKAQRDSAAGAGDAARLF